MKEMLTAFGLTATQMRILFSIECYMVARDANEKETLKDKINPLAGDHEMKKVWCREFTEKLNLFMKEETKDSESCEPYEILTDANQIIKEISKESNRVDTNIWKYLILLECSLFTPYFPLSENKEENKKYKGLALNEDCRNDILKTVSRWLGVDYTFVDDVQKCYAQTVKKMNGYWSKVMIGVGAGVVAALLTIATAGGSIAALFAASGLYGAAAVSSGLAALGGGAIAAGGLGIAGGMAVLVGGGILLGSGAGASVSMALASTNPEGIMAEVAKLYVVMKEIILGIMQDTQRAQEIIGTVIEKIAELKKEITRLKLQQQENEKKIKNLEKSISYFEDFLKMAS